MIVPRAPLAAAAASAKLIARKSTLAILSNVLVTAKPENAWLTLTASDTVAQLALDVECEIDAEMEFCVEADRFAQALSVPGEEAKLTLKEHTLHVAVGRSKFKFPIMPAADFPLFKAEGEKVAMVAADWLPEAFEKIAPFVSNDFEPRAHCRGIVVQVDESGVTLTGTNGGEMARFMYGDGGEGKCHKIIPTRSAMAAASLGCNRLLVRPQCAVLLGPNVQIITALIEGQLPDVSGFMPKGSHSFTAKRAALIEAVEVARGLMFEKVRGIKLLKAGDSVTIGSRSQETESEISVEASGDDLELGFNSEYLLDLLRIAKGEDVKIEWDTMNAVAVRGGGYIAIAAPFRV